MDENTKTYNPAAEQHESSKGSWEEGLKEITHSQVQEYHQSDRSQIVLVRESTVGGSEGSEYLFWVKKLVLSQETYDLAESTYRSFKSAFRS